MAATKNNTIFFIDGVKCTSSSSGHIAQMQKLVIKMPEVATVRNSNSCVFVSYNYVVISVQLCCKYDPWVTELCR